jgi:hypothetical protein
MGKNHYFNYIYTYIEFRLYLKVPQQSVSSVTNHQVMYMEPRMKQTVAEL